MIVAGTRVPYPVRSIIAVLRGLSLAVRRGHILVLVLVYFVPLGLDGDYTLFVKSFCHHP